MKTVPLEEALKVCAETGYGNVELALNPGWPTEPKLLDAAARARLSATLRERGLTLSGLMLNMSLATEGQAQVEHLRALAEAAQLAHELQPAQPPLIETVLGGKPAEWDAIKDKMASNLRAWAAVAEKARITLAIKGHVLSAVNSPERLQWLLEQAPSPALAVAFDYSHYELQGMPLAPALKLLAPKLRFVHVKDFTGQPGKFQFLLPGEGTTDYPALFQALRGVGYTGPIVVEVSGQVFNKPGYDPVAAARSCFSKLAPALHTP